MTEASKRATSQVATTNPISHQTSTSSFSTAYDPGIVVDMEIQPGDPVDSQIIRNFMGEFEAASKKTFSEF